MNSPNDEPVELDEAQIVRPERFILPDVSGMTVPLRIRKDGKTLIQWRLLLQWNDGRREEIALSDCISTGGGPVYLQPGPREPEPSQIGRWSTEARQRWLRGEATMPPDELCRRLLEGFSRYLHVPSEDDRGIFILLTCWSILTYVHPVFDAVPYIAIGGPAESGKTKVLDLLQQLVFRPIPTSNCTNSALFRLLDAFGGTAILDEAERFQNVNSPDIGELMSSLLAGYRRGKCITKTESLGDGSFAPRHYCVSGPKAIACINSLPVTLASRCVPIPMFRCPKDSPKYRLRIAEDNAEWGLLRDALHAMAMENGPDWLALPARQDVCPDIGGRNYELWQPLLAIAAWLEERGAINLLGTLREFALRSIDDSRDVTTPPEDEILLQALASLLASGVRPTANQILDAAARRDRNLVYRWTAKRVSSVLSRYGLKTRPSHGRAIYDPSIDSLRAVRDSYRINLDLPQPADGQALPPGGHGAHGGRLTQGV